METRLSKLTAYEEDPVPPSNTYDSKNAKSIIPDSDTLKAYRVDIVKAYDK